MLKYKLFFLGMLLSIIVSCTSEKAEETNHAQSVLTTQNVDTVILEQVHIFEDGSEVFMPGSITNFEVDDNDNVHMSSLIAGEVGIYTFNGQGEFLKRIGQYGRGPGDFEAIASLAVDDNNLYVFDSRLQKISVFSTANHEFTSDKIIETKPAQTTDIFTQLMRGKTLFPIEKGQFLLLMFVELMNDFNKYQYERLYRINNEGVLVPGKVTEVKKHQSYNPKGFNMERPKPIFTAPFTRASRIAVSDAKYVYTNWTEDFTIYKIHYEEGVVDSIHYPYQNALLDLSDTELSKNRLNDVKEQGHPTHWPAIYTIVADDNKQLWVGTITESDSTYQWYVLDEEGELRARFTLPGRRNENFVASQPLIKIKNGYFYEHEFNYEADIDRIVKYHISFKENR